MKIIKCSKNNGAKYGKKNKYLNRGSIVVHISSIVNEAIKTNSNFFKKNFCSTKSTKQVLNNKSNNFSYTKFHKRGKSFILCFYLNQDIFLKKFELVLIASFTILLALTQFTKRTHGSKPCSLLFLKAIPILKMACLHPPPGLKPHCDL